MEFIELIKINFNFGPEIIDLLISLLSEQLTELSISGSSVLNLVL